MLNDKGEEVGIIYGWYCIPTEMWYIGQTIHPDKRFKAHIYQAKSKYNKISIIDKEIRKYGLDKFIYKCIKDNVLIKNLDTEEKYWINYYNSFNCGYNGTTGGHFGYKNCGNLI